MAAASGLAGALTVAAAGRNPAGSFTDTVEEGVAGQGTATFSLGPNTDAFAITEGEVLITEAIPEVSGTSFVDASADATSETVGTGRAFVAEAGPFRAADAWGFGYFDEAQAFSSGTI